jgi:hypothetical protein
MLLKRSVDISLHDAVDPVRLRAEMHEALSQIGAKGFTLNAWTPPSSFPAG